MNALKATLRLLFVSALSVALALSFEQYSWSATEEEIAASSQSIFTSIMSPYCPGKLLSDCPSAQASELKEQIREKLSAGQNKDNIIQELKDQYGEQTLLAEPEMAGFGAVAWIVPALFLFSGLIFIAKIVKK